MDFAAISNMLLELFYILIGIMMLSTTVLSLKDKSNPGKIWDSIILGFTRDNIYIWS